jgi:hypothetical protein
VQQAEGAAAEAQREAAARHEQGLQALRRQHATELERHRQLDTVVSAAAPALLIQRC